MASSSSSSKDFQLYDVSSISNVSEQSSNNTEDFIKADEKLTELMRLMGSLKAKSAAIFQEAEKFGEEKQSRNEKRKSGEVLE